MPSPFCPVDVFAVPGGEMQGKAALSRLCYAGAGVADGARAAEGRRHHISKAPFPRPGRPSLQGRRRSSVCPQARSRGCGAASASSSSARARQPLDAFVSTCWNKSPPRQVRWISRANAVRLNRRFQRPGTPGLLSRRRSSSSQQLGDFGQDLFAPRNRGFLPS